MKTIKLILAFMLSIVIFSSCEKEDLAGINCDLNHTAVVTFENHSTSNTTYDIYWNNILVETISPGKKSDPMAYAVGEHTYVFKKHNTNIVTCSPSYPNLAQCYSYTFSCEY